MSPTRQGVERSPPEVDPASTPWCPHAQRGSDYAPRVPDSPLDAHVATPQDLKERLAAERRGTRFLVYRGADTLQVIVDLAPGGEVETLVRPPTTSIVVE